MAIVTGAGRGVGRVIATSLALNGWAVACAARTSDEVVKVVDAISHAGGSGLAIEADVVVPADVERMVKATVAELGTPVLLVNNAGTGVAVGPLWEVDPDAWWRDVEVSLRGTFLCSRAVLPGMIERREGRIINVASYSAIKASPYHSGYAAAKPGSTDLARSGVFADARTGAHLN